MKVCSLELKDFRNYEALSMNFDKGTNILYGDNAQGKTNILEAVYLCATSKSHRGGREKEMIRFGCEQAHIRLVVERDNQEITLDVHLKKNRSKGIAINHFPIKKAADLYGILNIIFFSPEDLNIVRSGPSERRRFIDSQLCQMDKLYLYNLSNYNRILNQRNKLLKDITFHPEWKDTLSVWDEQLADFGEKIVSRRAKFMEEISPLVHEIHANISGNKEDLFLSYQPDTPAGEIAKALERNREKDLKFGQTNAGPHRDDMGIKLSEVDMRRFGSQGQQRTCALSLKLSEIQLLENAFGEKPVLLLDDVMSELDGNRQNFLLKSLYDTQTLITCTGMDDFVRNHFPMHKVFEVISGRVQEKSA